MREKLEILTYEVDSEDSIRKQKYHFYQKVDEDGFKETVKILADRPNYRELKNRQGTWQLANEAVKIEFAAGESDVSQDEIRLLSQYPADVEFKWHVPSTELCDGIECYAIEMKISVDLISKLSEKISQQWRRYNDPKEKSGQDPREFVVGRRCYLIGVSDSLLYGVKLYDGHGDLCLERRYAGYNISPIIPDDLFKIPEYLPIYVARSRSDLAKRRALEKADPWKKAVAAIQRLRTDSLTSSNSVTEKAQ